MFLVLSIFINILLISSMFYIFRQNRMSHRQFEELKQQIAQLNSTIAVYEEKLFTKSNECQKYENLIHDLTQKKDNLEKKIIEANANIHLMEKNQLIAEQKIKDLDLKNHKIHEENQVLSKLNSKLEAELKQVQEKHQDLKKEIEDLHKKSQLNFENIANKIFQEKSAKFTEINKENMTQILEPLGQNIANFKKQVADTYDKDSKERLVLQEQIKNLFEQTNKVSSEANNLASALKGSSKKQGNWGEMILETILQHSGLQRDIHYIREKSFNDENGKNLRPDFQILLPDNRLIITDSKVSLNAYNKFCENSNEAESQKYLAEHLKAVRNHIELLSEKKYDNLEKSLDFTMMFMPVEPAYLLAIQADENLWSDAYSKRILLVSPTNLIACLKIIDDLWKRELQSKNAMAIVYRGEKLYEKFIGVIESIQEIGKKLNDSQKSYDNVMRLISEGRGNLSWQAETLKNLGLKSEKKIPIDFDYLPEEDNL